MSVEKDEKVIVTAVDFGSKGEAVCKYKGFTIFVDGAVPGDEIKVKVYLKKKNYAKGKILEFIKKSDYRVNPPCKYFGVCGGCQIQNFDYLEQLKYKRENVKNTIERIGKIESPLVKETIGMEEPYKYRNKGQFPIQLNNNKVEIGFYKIGSHSVVDLDRCLIQEDISNDILNIVKKVINNNNISVYNEKNHKGILRHVIIRTAYETKDTMVILVTNGNDLPFKNKFISELSDIKEVKSIVQNINKKRSNRILGFKNKTIYGDSFIVDTIEDLKFKISPLSFFQVNPEQTKKLYDKTLEYAGLTGNEVVFDLYCGIGSISLFLAKKAKKVYGVEIIDDAIKDARKNAKNNNINNAEFITGKSEEVIPNMYKDGIKADVVVLDPPRKGCDETLLKTIVDMKSKKIVYVSCKPSTLARDLKYLTKNGYYLIEAQPVDMFPHSTHVETVVLLKKL